MAIKLVDWASMRTLKGMRLVDLPLGVAGGSVHTLYLKAHGNDDGNTLFVGNVDYGGIMSYQVIDAYLKELFSDFGKIESVSVSKVKQTTTGENDDEILPGDKKYNYRNENNENSRFAHVTFVKKSAIKSILAASDSVYYELAKNMAFNWGMYKRLGQSHITECKGKSSQDIRKSLPYIEINTDDLQRDVDSYMKDFDEQEQLQLLEQKKKQNVPDEDGFITVVNRKNKKRKRGDENKRAGAEQPRNREKKKKDKELKNFYTFQIKEQKIEKLELLRKKFEEDKERVAAMKAARKFKPF